MSEKTLAFVYGMSAGVGIALFATVAGAVLRYVVLK